jgi:hypothetical protein
MPGIGRAGRVAIIFAHTMIGWAYCGALIAIGRQLFSMQTTLVIHAIGAALGFVVISFVYFRKFCFTNPMQTAVLFLSIVVGLDLFLVAPVVERSFLNFKHTLDFALP